MAFVNTSLTFTTENQSLWASGPGLNFYIDTGDYLVYDPGEQVKNFSFDAGIFDVSFDAYIDVRFGLVAWANLGTAGVWDAEYELDLTVGLPGASYGDRDMLFDFTRYQIVSAEISSLGFGAGEKGIGAGLDLIIDVQAGARNITLETWIKDFNFGGFSLIDIDEEINLISVTLRNPEFTLNLFDGVELTARLPQGADTEGSSQGSGYVEGHGSSDVRFIELSADLDELLTGLLQKLPAPANAVGKVLAETVFAEHSFDLGNEISLVPYGAVTFEFTMVDIGAGVGLVITEDVALDITVPGASEVLDINIRLVSDNGTPGDTADDRYAYGKLGEVLTLRSPSTPLTGTAIITADFSVARAHFAHEVGLGVNASITIDILQGSLDGSWVPGFLKFSFGPLLEIEYPEGGWNAELGNLFSDDFEIAGSAFNTEHAEYSVFYVQESVAFTGWDPELPGAEEAIYGYFEASYKQLSASFEQFDTTGFDTEPDALPTEVVLNYSSAASYPTKVYFLWVATQDNDVTLNSGNGSLVMVAPEPPPNPQTGAIVQGNLGVSVGGSDLLFDSSWQAMYVAAYTATTSGSIAYTYDAKTITTHGKTNAVGNERGDIFLYYGGSDFFDGRGNNGFEGGAAVDQWDVFVADLRFFNNNKPLTWDLARSVELENDGDAQTMGGVTLGLTADEVLQGVQGDSITVRNVEAAVLFTGNGADYLVGGVQSDVFVTGGGDDIVKLVYFVPGANGGGASQVVDVVEDYVRLDGGNDTAIVELGNIPNQTGAGTDYIFGGSGIDNVFIRSGGQGLRYDIHYEQGGVSQGYLFGGGGLGADASHADLAGLVTLYNRDIEANYNIGVDNNFYSPSHFLLMNGGPQQGRIEIATDVEHVSILPGGYGVGDDLLVFMGGTRYDGGSDGDDTFAADFGAWQWLLGTRGGLQLNLDLPVSYFGQTVIENIDRLHVIGTSDSDVIYGGLLDDYIEGGGGNDFISGGIDTVADELRGGDGNDTFLWVNSGNDSVYGSVGSDTIFIRHHVDDDYEFGGSSGVSYTFYDAFGDELVPGIRDYELDLMEFAATADSQLVGFLDRVLFTSIEHVNVRGSNSASDQLIYQGGNYYIGGENLTGLDEDVFIADFSGQGAGIDFRITDNFNAGNPAGDAGYWLGNDVFVQGIDRGVIRGGEGLDILIGGRFGDHFIGGGGNDVLYGGIDNSPDTLEGGEGSDTFYWYSDPVDSNKRGGSDTFAGGTNLDGSFENDHLILGGGQGPSRVKILEFNVGLDEWVEILPYDGSLLKGFAWAYQDTAPENSHNFRPSTHSDRSTIQTLAENSLRSDLKWEYYTSNIVQQVQVNNSGPYYDWRDPSLQAQGGIEYQQMESVDIVGSDMFDDIVVYQHGAGYVGGERAGDGDLFVADLREFSESLRLDVNFEPGIGYDIGQGTRIADFERLHVLLGAGDDTVQGGDLDDTAYAGDGNDQLAGGYGNDHFYGEGGNDFFEHNGGKDVFDGGLGNDVLLVGATANPFEVAFFDVSDVQIGPRYSMASGTLGISDFGDLYGTTGDATITIYHGDNELQFTGMEEVQISGSEQNDVLVSGTVQGVLFGGAGNDALISRGGNDFMAGGEGADIYVFGSDFGNDLIFGEGFGAGRLVFVGSTQAELSYALHGGVNLLVSQASNSVLVLDYFASNASVGLNFIFETSDAVFTKDFSALGAVSPGAPVAGVTYMGTDAAEDIVVGTGNSDLIRAFGGDDFILASAGRDLIDGGTGSDAVSYFHSDAAVTVDLLTFSGSGGFAQGDRLVSIEHIAGSVYADTVTGNNFGNVISGSSGNDTVFGLDGDDLLSGDEGQDNLDGGSGNDRVYGGPDNDTLLGGLGTDYLSGGDGADSLVGGFGADILEDGLGNDTARGDEGNDIFIFTGGVDEWDGGADIDSADYDKFGAAIQVDLTAADKVLTRDAPDLESGGALRVLTHLSNIENIRGTVHADSLEGDDLANQLEGNLGNDWFVGNWGIDTLVGGAGTDTVDYSMELGGQPVQIYMSAVGGDYGYDTWGDQDLLSGIENVIGTALNDYIQGSDADNVILGGAQNDSLHGLVGNDTLSGESGDDSLTGGTGNDLLMGGSGQDTLRGEAGDDTLMGGSEDDTLEGTGGNDLIYGDDGHDELVGGTGDDILVGGLGNDTAYGDDGDDLFIAGTDGLGDDTYDGDSHFDTVSYTGTTAGITVSMSSRTVVGPEIGTDTLWEIENVVGGTGNDTMTGNSEDNTFSYFGGMDSYDGNEGRDTVNYSEFHSAVLVNLTATDEGQTRDMSDLKSGTLRTITQLTEMENIVGSDFDDELTGDAQGNIIAGGKGDDRLDGGAGDDTVSGGDGNDVFVAVPGNESDIDSYDGGAGIDTLDYSTYGDFVIASLVDGDGDDVLVSIERLVGSNFGSYLYGTGGNDIIQPGTDEDLIFAGAGDDWIVYTGGYDYIYAEDGIDTVDYSLAGFAISLDFNEFGHDPVTFLSRDAVFTGDTASWNVGTQRAIGLIFDHDVENAIGSAFDDKLVGDGFSNMFNGGQGNDLVLGMGGNDNFAYTGGLDNWDGGAGADTANFSTFGFAVKVDLGASGALVQTRGGSTVASGAALVKIVDIADIEDIIGTNFDDMLIGDGQVNRIMGGAGDDTIDGGLGADLMDGGDGNDTYTVDNVGDAVKDSSGFDTVLASVDYTLAAGLEKLTLTGAGGIDGSGNNLDNTLTGNGGANRLLGGLGDDTIDGGAGFDTAVFAGLRFGYAIARGPGGVTVVGADGTDLLTSVEKLLFDDQSVLLRGADSDFDGDGKSDVLFRNSATGVNTIWKNGNSANGLGVSPISDANWKIVGVGDFGGDGLADILWRNSANGQGVIWNTGNSATIQGVSTLADLAWKVAGVGDFDGDGKADILFRNAGTGVNTIWKGGDSATSQSVLPLVGASWEVAGVGDFDGDGMSDILWRNNASGVNAIWKSAVGMNGQAVATLSDLSWKVAGVGDFDGDGQSDILWRNTSTGVNAIWKSGNSATSQGVSPITDQNWQVVGTGDYGGDGKADILWRNGANGQGVIWNSGDSTMIQGVSTLADLNWKVAPFQASASPARVASDFDGDGKSDVLFRNTGSGVNTIWKGANSAASQGVSPITSQDWKIVGVGDFGGDGKADILWRNSVNGQGVIWNGGNSTTIQGVSSLSDPNWKVAGVGDFDGDGKADILFRNGASGVNTIWKGGNSATSQSVLPLVGASWEVVGVGDFDGDAKSDILWRNNVSGVNAIWKSANGMTGQAVSSLSDPNWKVAGVGDFDGDGKSDILWRNSTSGVNTIWKSGNSATSLGVSPISNQDWQIAAVGDYGGDGKADILWRNSVNGQGVIWNSGNSATIQAFSTLADLNWKVAPYPEPPASTAPVLNDFDGDGKSDLLWRNTANGSEVIWKSANSATVQGVNTLGDQNWKVMALGDFDGDGKADILWRNTSSGANTIWKSGNSATSQAVSPLGNLDWKIMGAGDFDGDGKADILWRNTTNGQASIWKSGNVGTMQSVSTLADQNWKVAGIGDFDGDGKSDILWRNTASGVNTIWKSGNSATSQGVSPLANQDFKVVGVGDFDGDGKSDILWRNGSTGVNAIWKSANGATPQAVSTLSDLNWQVVGTGDYDGDGKSDILWRNASTGVNAIWKSANSATSQSVSPITDQNWAVLDGLESGDLLRGGNGANTLYGTINADVLYGGPGADTMTGGPGADLFRYLNPGEGSDSIRDFVPGLDKLQLTSAGFAGLAPGVLAGNNFVSGIAPAPNLVAPQFLYDTTTGLLAFDADGTGGGTAVTLVSLVGMPTITTADVVVLAV